MNAEKKGCCIKAEFAAFIHFAGYLKIGKDISSLVVRVSKSVSARRAIALGKEIFGFEVKQIVKTISPFETLFEVEFHSNNLAEQLSQVGIINPFIKFPEIPAEGLLKTRCCKESFLRGVFLANGYILKPEKGRHVEFHLKSKESAYHLVKAISDVGLNPHLAKRKHRYIVYLKNYEDIKSFLYLIGAKSASFLFEDLQTVREVKNDVNRFVNFELANLKKTADTSSRQIEAINLIERTLGLNSLPPVLKEIAGLRKRYEHATYEKLAQFLGEGHTKSAVNHRLRRIEKIAGGIKENKSKGGKQ